MRKPQAPKIIFFDIDETLYHHAEDKIPTSIFTDVVPRLKARGIIPAIATGRTIAAFPPALKPLMNQDGIELFVTTNGQYNLYQGQIISQYPLTRTRIERLIIEFQQLGIEYAFVTPEEIAVSRDTPEIQEALRLIKSDYIAAPDYYQNHTVIQLLAFFGQERDDEIRATALLGDDLKMVRWHPHSIDLLAKENSKAVGIQDALAHLGLKMEEVMAFGDGLNDIEMLSMVGFGVAMGNAVPELKALADYVTKPITEDGILYALESLRII